MEVLWWSEAVAADASWIVWSRRFSWWWSGGRKEAVDGGAATGSHRQRVEASDGAWGFSGPPLEVLKTQVDGFFRYEANGMGGETQK